MTLYHDLYNIVMLLFCFQSKYADALGKIKKILTCTQVVELLLSKGANKEHRNVSDYTPLSLAASGGYVNIIKLLLSHGAEINSRYKF